MKRRIRKLEKVSNNKADSIYVLEENEKGQYTQWGSRWNKEIKKIYTPEEVEELEKDNNNLILIIKWV